MRACVGSRAVSLIWVWIREGVSGKRGATRGTRRRVVEGVVTPCGAAPCAVLTYRGERRGEGAVRVPVLLGVGATTGAPCE